MKFLFIVQGEGRGHLTQAIALFQILTENGHEVSHVIVGKSKRRVLPSFFLDKITVPITQLETPNFVTDHHSQSIHIFKTCIINLVKVGTFLKSVKRIDDIAKIEKPDTILNFYDFLGGLYYLLRNPKIDHIALGHQFFLNHSQSEFPKGKIYDKMTLLSANKLVAFKAKKILCLSFREMEDEPQKRLHIVPPILRDAVKSSSPTNRGHFLMYILNHGYSEQVKALHKQHPDVVIHCFWDKKDAPNELNEDDTLTFHRLDDDKFIYYMASCKGYLTTAGFESVCEAMYLGKGVLMVPVEGHYEQACNALDAKKVGAGISNDFFDLKLLLEYLPFHKGISVDFQKWCAKAHQMFLEKLTKDDH